MSRKIRCVDEPSYKILIKNITTPHIEKDMVQYY